MRYTLKLLLLFAFVIFFTKPAQADLFDRVRETVEDTVDPGGWLREGAETLNTQPPQAEVQHFYTIHNRTNQSLAFEINEEKFSLSAGYAREYRSSGDTNFYLSWSDDSGQQYSVKSSLQSGYYVIDYDSQGGFTIYRTN